MKLKNIISVILGIALIALGFYLSTQKEFVFFMPSMIGISLVYLGYKRSRIALLVFGHACVIVGCFLVTWGIYLLPYSEPKLAHIFGRPLFWGLFSIFGGICAIYHGFCRCISRSEKAEDGD
jgi:hypothetical protein